VSCFWSRELSEKRRIGGGDLRAGELSKSDSGLVGWYFGIIGKKLWHQRPCSSFFSSVKQRDIFLGEKEGERKKITMRRRTELENNRRREVQRGKKGNNNKSSVC